MASKQHSRKIKKKRKKHKRKACHLSHRKFENAPQIVMGYYNRAFDLFHSELSRLGYDSEAPHPIRQRFWQFVPTGEFELIEARGILHRYLISLAHEFAEIVCRSSLAYWLHLYRRLSPGPIGRDKQPQTIGLTRAVLEAAIQKFAKFESCGRIGESNKVPIDKVLGGILAGPDFRAERQVIKKSGNQLVLTDFTHINLNEFYDTEKLAYEIWRTSATLRTIGKGAPLVVEETPTSFRDDRSGELARLLEIYDNRSREIHICSTGAIFEGVELAKGTGIVFVPIYNLAGIESNSFNHFFEKVFNIKLIAPVKFNFIWIPFNIKSFRAIHLPLAEAFEIHHGVSLDAVLSVISALLSGVFYIWTKKDIRSLYRYWQRAYEGPHLKTEFKKIIKNFMSVGMEILGIQDKKISSDDFEAAIGFWELTAAKRQDIDLVYSGPHYVFLPHSNDRWFIDYAWILRRLYDLFVGVSIDDQNFKGDALEEAIGRDSSFLPTRQCKAYDGTKRQIDYAIPIGKHLVILECKAVGRSVAYDRGDPKAIKYRLEKVVERALREADEKARWLAKHSKGTNYDITQYKDIVPIAISPFVEFIPSLESRYWITDDIPRVLTPSELQEVIKDSDIISKAMNRVAIESTG